MRRDPQRKSVRLPRRGTDRLEDAAVWLLLLAGLLTAVLALVIGLGVSASSTARAHQQAVDRVAVQAAATHDVPALGSAPGAPIGVLTEVGWTAADGSAHTGMARIPTGTTAGQAVTIWVDRTGTPVGEPADASAAALDGLGAGAVIVVIGGSLLMAVWLGARYWIAQLNERGWAREWARVGPEWTGHGRHDADRAAD